MKKAAQQPSCASLRDIFDSTRLSRLRKVLATDTATAWLVTLIVHCFDLTIYPWVMAGLLCNVGLDYIFWISTDGLYNTHWTWLLFRSRIKQTAYLSIAAEVYAFKALCRVLLKCLERPDHILSHDSVSDTLIAITWIIICVLDWKVDGLLLTLLLRVADIAASLFARPLFLGICWLNKTLPSILRPRRERSSFQYRYSPLAAGEIRLLLLPRRLPFCAIELEVLIVKLVDAPPYEAISYTWGTSKQTRDISVDGKTFTTSVAAYEVLQGRSSMWRSRLVWIDYICINQEDLSEKAAQVEQMIEVYHEAQRVVVWLGGFAFGRKTISTMDMIHLLSLRLIQGLTPLEVYEGLALHQETFEWLSFIQLWSHNWFTRLWIVQEAAVAKEVYFCYGGMVYPWRCFTRIADVFKSPDLSVLLNRTPVSRKAQQNMSTIGFIEQLRPILWHNRTVEAMNELRDAGHALSVDPISEAIDIWTKLLYDRTFRPIIREGVLSKDKTISPIPLSFTHLLTAFATLDVTDNRDRVYALRGMVTGAVSTNTKPDYSKSVETLYTNMAADVWMSKSAFGIVGWAGIGWPRRLHLPSFVPDWSSVPKLHVPLTSACNRVEEIGLGYNASGGTEPAVGYASTDYGPSLHIKGIILDAIHMRGDILPQDYQFDNDDSREGRASEYSAQMKWMNDVQELARHANSYRGDDAMTDALWRTLIVDRKAEQHPAPAEMREEFQRWLEFSRKCAAMVMSPDGDDKDRQLTSEELSFFREALTQTWSTHMAGGCSGRRFGITTQGRMGMLLPGAQVGDKICIAYGAATLWVVRHVDKTSGTKRPNQRQVHAETDHDYQLVGECYLHGVMKGEAMSEDHQPIMIRLW